MGDPSGPSMACSYDRERSRPTLEVEGPAEASACLAEYADRRESSDLLLGHCDRSEQVEEERMALE